MKKLRILRHLSAVLLPIAAAAESPIQHGDTDELVISATRIETPVRHVASSTTIITSEELNRQRRHTVLEALRKVPGVDVVQSGGPGGNTSVFIRGANSEHTLVMIDGIEVNDPGSPNRTFNFANLTVDNIERIEIIRGPQSTLYGSDAIGGVINIITKTGREKPGLFVSSEAGSYHTYTQRIEAGTGFDRASISAGFSRQDAKGISAAAEKYENSEYDAYENTSGSARLLLEPTDTVSFDFVLRAIRSETDLDNFGGSGGDDLDRLLKTDLLAVKAETRIKLFEDMLDQSYRISYSEHRRRDNSDPDRVSPELLRSRFDGDLLTLDWQNALSILPAQTLLFGFEWSEEQADSRYLSAGPFGEFQSDLAEVDATNRAWYLQNQIDAGILHTALGARVDDHSEFGSKLTWRIAPALVFEEMGTTLRSSVGTGYKAPSLAQLYSTFGNSNLKPEESLSVDAGVEQSFCNGDYTVGATYFWSEFDDLIQLNSATFELENVAEAGSQGFELFASAAITQDWRTGLSFTYTDTEDKQTRSKLLRRPDTKIAVDTHYRLSDKWSGSLEAILTGERKDLDFSSFPAERVTLSDYTLINTVISYDWSDLISLFARIDNLTDQDYEPVLGYGALGFAAYGGLEVTL